MTRRSAQVPFRALVRLVLVFLTSSVGVAAAGPPAAIRIGMSEALFQDVPKPLVMVSMVPFKALMEAQTGVRGDLATVDDLDLLADQLQSGKFQLGVFHGVEFAWARDKHPALKPLAIAINEHRDVYAYLLVRRESTANGIGDLRNKRLAFPEGSRLWCRLFLEQACKDPRGHFGAIATPASLEEGLDDTVDGTVDAVVVDGVALECFQRRKPARFAQLKVLHKSEKFPAAVIAYREGSLDETTLQRFRGGLLDATRSIAGRQVLTLWRMTAFEPIPADYDRTLADILKSYPPRSRASRPEPEDVQQVKNIAPAGGERRSSSPPSGPPR